MNRLCQTSYGNLEAVINLAGYDGNNKRRLVHFVRHHTNGKWYKGDIVSSNPFSGGSIIQNSTKRISPQDYGDFEVLVLEEDGLMKHYTRDNTICPHSGQYAWRLSTTVNKQPDPHYGKVVVCDAAPLHLSKIPVGDSSNGTALETALLTNTGDVLHYRCPQQWHNSKDISPQWELTDRITTGATGPACLYTDSRDILTALIPLDDGIVQFSFMNGAWSRVSCIPRASGPACTYNPNPAEPLTLYVVARRADELSVNVRSATRNQRKVWEWSPSQVQLPSPLRRLFWDSHYMQQHANPMAIVSQSLNVLGHSANAEAIVFHPCGTGWQDRWMILHWSCLTGSQEWIVSGVVLNEVMGIPM
ncbi:hypothetical protein F5Y13DRAFT_189485 [Hypoxylon sp. FL1857]|nr:hypothetical protein F5Y13DRAFT_189485 [Hypoxylon sp. FL1857]